MGQAPELRIWRIEQFKVVPWPKEQYGQFHVGDSYLVMNTYKKNNTSEALAHDLHIWIGSESSQDEYGTAAYKMVEADDFLGGIPVQHRQVQGHESAAFHAYFQHPAALEYLQGGVASGFRHVEPTIDTPVLYRVKGHKKTMTLTQMPVSKSSLNEGDSFILTCGKAKVWVWHGKHVRLSREVNDARRFVFVIVSRLLRFCV
jgi:gelsolin